MEVAICAVVCNFPDDEISLFINTVTNIRSRFELILETHSSNLQNSKQYSAENLYLIGRRQLLPGLNQTMETDRTFGSNQCDLRVRTMESQ